ncbi:sugar (pentulose or hexulose) kinase [Salinibacterium sp. CAN_S4]|uniref:FGGY-family carbohydrate kinase n=1 Tax=Salinibacterium sp. CAN_S4 TaxID=2787727 RepID=UPI0018EFB697
MTSSAGGRFVVAIDNGSQSTKVMIFDEHGNVHASAQQRLRPYDTSMADRVVHPGDDLWDSVAATCREALDAFGGDPAEIAGVGLCTIRFCRALLDHDGLLVEPVLSWMDARVSRPHVADDDRVARITTSSGYITGRLTGAYRDTVANYQGVWPIDVERRAWSLDDADYAATGMRRDQLAELVEPGELLGLVTRDASAATGLPEGLPVFATANDKAVEALGSGLVSDDEALLSLGTYIAAMTPGRSPVSTSNSYWVNFDSRPGGYLNESGGIRRGMWTVSWYRDLLTSEGGPAIDEGALEEGALDVPIGSGGLFAILDWLAPGDHPERRGAFLGFDGSQGRYHLYRAVLESIAFTMRVHLIAMEAALGRRCHEVIVSGGGSRSVLMLDILANVLDRPVRRTAVTDAAGLGAAICAFVGAGIHPDWDTAVRETVHVATRVEPDPEAVATYAPYAAKHAGLAHFTDPLFTWLNSGPTD